MGKKLTPIKLRNKFFKTEDLSVNLSSGTDRFCDRFKIAYYINRREVLETIPMLNELEPSG